MHLFSIFFLPYRCVENKLLCKELNQLNLTFLLQLVVVQQQADHLFGFECVWFEVASGDHHPLDLITQAK